MQEGEEKKFKLHGNSSYFNKELLASGCGKGMSSIREAIEWRRTLITNIVCNCGSSH
jgi:hypothetical protein